MFLVKSLMLTLPLMIATTTFGNKTEPFDLDKISMAIKTGNAGALAKYFDNSVEVTIVNKEGAYSKSQAELVVKDFFAKNTVKGFEVVHQGSSGGNSKYAIGTLTTNTGNFRAYIYLKKKGEAFFIQELSFEKK